MVGFHFSMPATLCYNSSLEAFLSLSHLASTLYLLLLLVFDGAKAKQKYYKIPSAALY